MVSGVSAEDPRSNSDRLARLESKAYEPENGEKAQVVPSLPDWLDRLLTMLPVDAEEMKPETAEESGAAADVKETTPSEAAPVRSTEAELTEAIESLEQRPTESEDPFFPKPKSITPLYTSPKLEGEGIWTGNGMPNGRDGRPLVYKTVYRPSVEYPNAVVHMAVFDMVRIRPRLFIGSTEPGIYQISDTVPDEDLSRIVAITNAMWMQRHARGAGAVFRGQVIYPMVPGMATMVVYYDDSVDIIEWSEDIPLQLVRDARQLRHLIVKDGLVVDEVYKNGEVKDSEIGLGGFLVDNRGNSTMRNKFWFLANRTAFGIRPDGNLVFAMGHHISTKDLAKALVLAGCERAIHGDANIHNIVCNFYYRNRKQEIVKREKLSPEQLKYTLKRYDDGYTKDFFAFYEK